MLQQQQQQCELVAMAEGTLVVSPRRATAANWQSITPAETQHLDSRFDTYAITCFHQLKLSLHQYWCSVWVHGGLVLTRLLPLTGCHPPAIGVAVPQTEN